MPFPSAACQTCKIRRIKCDETKPTCQRCTKSRRKCFQKSTKQASFSIHLENSYASGKRKRPRGPHSSLTLVCPQFDLQTRAVGYYLQFHTRAPADVPSAPQGLSECIYVWKVSRRACPMVDVALSCMALSVFSRIKRHPSAATEASTKYQRLLRIVQKRISQLDVSHLDEEDIDACLLSIYLMGRYEAATGGSATLLRQDSPSFRHHDGALAILRMWNDDLTHIPATFTMKQTRRGLMRSALLRKLPVPTWMSNGSRFGERGIELEFDHIYVQVINLHHLCSLLCLQPRRPNVNAVELMDKAEGLDEALQIWAAKLSSMWPYQQVQVELLDNWATRHFYSTIVYTYPNPIYASVWAHYFLARMLINSSQLSVMGTFHADSSVDFFSEQRQLNCTSILATTANDLASTVPFCLERFKIHKECNSKIPQSRITLNTNEEIKPHLANLILWPLSIASSVEGINQEQQAWFKAELARLGRVLGAGIFESAEENWLKLSQ